MNGTPLVLVCFLAVLCLYQIQPSQATGCITFNTKHLYRGSNNKDEEEEEEEEEDTHRRVVRDVSNGDYKIISSTGDPPPRLPPPPPEDEARRSNSGGKGGGKNKGKGGKDKKGNDKRTAQPQGTTQGCSGKVVTLTTPGIILSPGYGTERYPTYAQCRWKLSAPKRLKVVQLKFSLMDLEYEKDCLYDSVSVYDGKNQKAEELGRFCGSEPPEDIVSTSREMYIEFTSDIRNSNYAGFSIRYEFITKPGKLPGCSSTPLLLNASEGLFASPKYPGKYPNNAYCTWHITVETGYVVSLHFDRFELESSKGCTRDRLEVFDGADPRSSLLGTFCGSGMDENILSSGTDLFVRFTSDGSKKKKGFKAEYARKVSPNGRNNVPVCGIPETLARTSARTIGGMQTIPNSWPWMVQFRLNHPYYGMTHWCGAVLIDQQHVLSAMHCTYDDTPGYEYDFTTEEHIGKIEMVLGEHDLNMVEGTELSFNVTKVIKHAGFDNVTFLNDIAIFKLDRPAPITRAIQPICLPDERLRSPTMCIIAGWGSTDPLGYGYSPVLNQVNVPTMDKATCSDPMFYGSDIKPGMLCAGFVEGLKDSCQGDSGGPLFAWDGVNRRFNLYGLISWGFGCAQPRKPGVYTDINDFKIWIAENIWT